MSSSAARRVAAVGVLLIATALLAAAVYAVAKTVDVGDPGSQLATGECPRPERDVEAPRTTLTPGVASNDVRFEDLQSTQNAVVIEDVAGMTVDEVQVWGKERGWAEFEIVDLTAQSFSAGGATNLDPTRFTIYHCGGHVVSAVVG
jgi:hypothetical protein